MPTSIATVQELSAALGQRDIGKADTDRMGDVLDAAAAMCERYTNRKFGPDPPLDEDGDDTNDPVVRHFPARGRARIRIPDLRSASSVTLDGLTLMANVGYQLEVFGGYTATSILLLSGFSTIGAFSSGDLAITGRWGTLEVPNDIKESVLELAARRYRKGDARWSDQIAVGDGQFTYFRGVVQDVQDVWSLYRVPNIALV